MIDVQEIMYKIFARNSRRQFRLTFFNYDKEKDQKKLTATTRFITQEKLQKVVEAVFLGGSAEEIAGLMRILVNEAIDELGEFEYLKNNRGGSHEQ